MSVLPERIGDLPESVQAEFRACMKKPIPIRAMPMDHDFRVQTLEGDYKQGKPGDYLMCGVAGELYICDREIFEHTYDWL